eukprot:CAMPEP_0114584642 /NCGR_PEP_ID=MMETSP0125-20121206/8307_1 /TAXON_ID=485358 ORGANISM="Aristerostoma sp., Strain ATCC 50986" /NCGR_SAMPLE_ID=MMETSP0125 /ASSEMBLY_ACC=CAM_ASM_000245 /LENGTH=53 /DNA_ID=CAMNT_0001779167 /DNA_START=449 /DNA_END=610 /DNA_ORIENTATION=+
MKAQNTAFYDCSNAKIVKDLSTVFPDIGIAIFLHNFLVESIHHTDRSRLMISS